MSFVRPAEERLWIPFVAILISAPIFGVLFMLLRGAPIILVPIAVGICASFLLMYSIWQGRIHDRVLGVALGLLFVILIYAFYQITSYFAFRIEQVSVMQAVLGIPREEAAAIFEDELIRITGADGIIGYYRLMMNMGFVLQSTVPINNQQVTGMGVLAYSGLELVMLGVAIISMAWTALNRPFCTNCGVYYGQMNLRVSKHGLERLGIMDYKLGAEFIRLLKADHLDQAGSMLNSGKVKASHTEVLIERCPTCDTNPFTLYIYRKVGQNSPALIKPLSRQQYDQLTAFAQIGAPQPIGGMGRWIFGMTVLGGFFVGLLLVIAIAMRS